MAPLIPCIGRRRLEISVKDDKVLIRIMILDDRNVLANLLLEPADANGLADVLIDAVMTLTSASRAKKKTVARKPKA